MRGIRLDRDDLTERCTGAIADLGADELVHPELAFGRFAERLGLDELAPQRFRAVAIVDAFEAHGEAMLIAAATRR